MNTMYERWSLLGEIPRFSSNKVINKASTILFITDISILDISTIISNLTVVAADHKPYQPQDKYQLQLQLQLQCQKVAIHQLILSKKKILSQQKGCETAARTEPPEQQNSRTAACMYMFCMHIPTQKQHSRHRASLPPCPITLLHSRQHQSSQSSSSTEPGCCQKVG